MGTAGRSPRLRLTAGWLDQSFDGETDGVYAADTARYYGMEPATPPIWCESSRFGGKGYSVERRIRYTKGTLGDRSGWVSIGKQNSPAQNSLGYGAISTGWIAAIFLTIVSSLYPHIDKVKRFFKEIR